MADDPDARPEDFRAGVIVADRGLRGPYTAGAAIAELLVADAPADLVSAHDIEIRTIAPDLGVPARRRSVAESRPRSERILVPARQRTLRVANGFAEFVVDLLRLSGPRTLVVEAVDRADPADTELLAVLRRRVPTNLLGLEVRSGAFAPGPAVGRPAAWHDRRAEEIAAGSAVGPRLGALLAHRENGSDPRRAAEDFAFAADWCLSAGCHDAAADIGRRGLAFADPDEDPETWWRLVHDTTSALTALEREEEAADLLRDAQRRTTCPDRQSTIAYSLAMVLTRHHDPRRRNLDAALGWINTAIAICANLPNRAARAAKLGFDLNAKALIEARRGEGDLSLRLVQEAIDLAEADLPPGVHPIHRLVLRANRARLRAERGDLDEALADLDEVIAADPVYPDYYVDRGNLLHRMGRDDDAVADYERAIRAGPPFPEPYYNRAEIRFGHGDLDGALADLDYALELDPDFLDARANRAGLLVALDRHADARADAEAGLARDPDNPYLLCALGQIEQAAGDTAAALLAFDRACERAPRTAVVWAGRGMARFEAGDHAAALADLTEALRLEDDPATRFNRAMVLRALGRTGEAEADLRRARELDPDDQDIAEALS